MIIMAGNPTRTDGPLWDACTRDRRLWWVIEITGDPDDPKRSPRISKEWARDQIERWGPDNPWVLVNVFGRFPPTQSNKLLGPEDIDSAMKRSYGADILNPWPIIFGGDVAKSKTRNRSVLWKRQGPVAWLLGEWRLDDHNLLAQQWARILADHQMRGEEVQVFFIDKGGMSGVHEMLVQLGWSMVIGVDNGEAASDPKFLNKRSELWWHMAKDVKTKLALPYNSTLKVELGSPTFEFRTVGTKGTRFVLESKEDMMDRGLESPDLADGLSLTYYAPASMKEDINRPKIRNQHAGRAVTAYEPFGGSTQDEKEEEYHYGLS
jgi:phage terminase large subunit